MNKVTFFQKLHPDQLFRNQDWPAGASWKKRCTSHTELSGEAAAEELFTLTNAPMDCLSEDQLYVWRGLEYTGPSLSVGDVVRVESDSHLVADYYECMPCGWQQVEMPTEIGTLV